MKLSDSQIQMLKKECRFTYSLSSGPGGQNVNKNSTKATLHWVLESSQLPERLKEKLAFKLKTSLTTRGELVVSSQTSRTQSTNAKNCLTKFIKLIEKALHVQKYRVPTKPSKSSIRKRLDSKKKDSDKKQNRKKVDY